MPTVALRVAVALSFFAMHGTAFGPPRTPPLPDRQVQGPDVDRLEATRICIDHAGQVAPQIIEWKKAENKKLGLIVESTTDTKIEWNSSAHFNGEMKRCFLEISALVSAKGNRLTVFDVYDAFEGQHVGSLTAIMRDGETREIVEFVKVFDEPSSESVYRALMRK